jgi:2'-5' RNA ligase
MEPSSGAHPVGVVNGNGNGLCLPEPVYALVAYINGELGEFLYSLRQEIVPTCRLRSHVSLLPPRKLAGAQTVAAEEISVVAGHHPAFDVVLGDICVFPVTNVIYLDLAAGREELQAMHADLNGGALAYAEPFAYHPHITLGQELTPEQFETGLALCRKRWAEYTGPRSFPVETITFVRNSGNCGWSDLEEMPMSPKAVPEPALH